MNIIKNIAPHKILTAQNQQRVILDFNCLLGVASGLQAPFIFMHWNKVLKKFAFYDPQNQIYRAVDADKILLESSAHSYLDVEKDSYPNLLPTAVIVYENATMREDSGYVVIDPFTPQHQDLVSEPSLVS